LGPTRLRESCELSNIGQTIRQTKQRLEQLQRIQEMEEINKEIGEVTLKFDKEENRVRLYSPDIPSKETRDKLKRNGFRWSRSVGCWQRKISNYAIHLARDIAKSVEADKFFSQVSCRRLDIANRYILLFCCKLSSPSASVPRAGSDITLLSMSMIA
jgi:hypothetical protein